MGICRVQMYPFPTGTFVPAGTNVPGPTGTNVPVQKTFIFYIKKKSFYQVLLWTIISILCEFEQNRSKEKVIVINGLMFTSVHILCASLKSKPCESKLNPLTISAEGLELHSAERFCNFFVKDYFIY